MKASGVARERWGSIASLFTVITVDLIRDIATTTNHVINTTYIYNVQFTTGINYNLIYLLCLKITGPFHLCLSERV